MTASRKKRRSPGRPAGNHEQDTRGLLLDSATGLFARHGAAATSFAMIAKQAGVTPAMLHYYFRDRDELMDAVADERLAPLLARIWGPVERSQPLDALLSGVVDRMLAAIQTEPWVPSTWMREVLSESGLLRRRVLERLPQEKLKIFADAIRHGQSEGRANPDLNPGLTVFSLIGLVMVHVAIAGLWPDVFRSKAPDRKALHRHIQGLLLRGLQPAQRTTST